ncbi:ABC transporter [Rhodocyclus tenuis]|uniref:ABC transporter n=1 Tax=Rhodocyclus gracilis TaxID=2929842 RepID=A0ABX0WJ74_9RHOO|nr:metal ABC transporter permease [Rhodocyclus gracilis]NJA88503.1 ABC transporter [Rhodocyclus gracilis]
MSLPEFFDPALFGGPFATGLCFAVALPLLGTYLRLRDEWLAALAFAQTAAAGALLAMLAGVPLALGGAGVAVLAATAKHFFEGAVRGAQGVFFALLLVLAWAASVLLAANLPLAERMAHALFDGQLYFSDAAQLVEGALCALAAMIVLRLLSRRLLLAHFFPEMLRASGQRPERARLVFDLLVAATLALATMSIGVMAAFALIFVPPLVAGRWAGHWRRALIVAVVCGIAAYTVAFVLALALDQPFGPLLGGLLVVVAALALLMPMRAAR